MLHKTHNENLYTHTFTYTQVIYFQIWNGKEMAFKPKLKIVKQNWWSVLSFYFPWFLWGGKSTIWEIWVDCAQILKEVLKRPYKVMPLPESTKRYRNAADFCSRELPVVENCLFYLCNPYVNKLTTAQTAVKDQGN